MNKVWHFLSCCDHGQCLAFIKLVLDGILHLIGSCDHVLDSIRHLLGCCDHGQCPVFVIDHELDSIIICIQNLLSLCWQCPTFVRPLWPCVGQYTAFIKYVLDGVWHLLGSYDHVLDSIQHLSGSSCDTICWIVSSIYQAATTVLDSIWHLSGSCDTNCCGIYQADVIICWTVSGNY